ncbi:MAG: DUF167 domain-containing protein [Patescibacteria group bacterium]
MRISVKAKTNAKKELLEKLNDNEFVVSVKEPPIDGRANWAICRVIAKHFGVSPSRASIVSGQSSKNKIVEII